MSAESPKELRASSFPRGSLLDRAQESEIQSLSGLQSEVDRLVSQKAQTPTDAKTMACLFGAGLAGRFTRLGTLSSAGNPLSPSLLWGLSHMSALAGESAVFAGLERGLTSPKGQARFQSFAKSWASAAINLGSLKLLGGISEGQKLILQHL